jgi:hypothetical protein
MEAQELLQMEKMVYLIQEAGAVAHLINMLGMVAPV